MAEENHQLNELDELKKEKDRYLAGWQRAVADFLNYKKEEMERIKTLIDYSSEEMILKILPLLDNLYLAKINLPSDLKENEFVKGLLQVIVQFENFLKSQGVEPIEAQGENFSPQFHEIVGETEIEGREAGFIVKEIQKGYLRNNQLLRPTKVIIKK